MQADPYVLTPWGMMDSSCKLHMIMVGVWQGRGLEYQQNGTSPVI